MAQYLHQTSQIRTICSFYGMFHTVLDWLIYAIMVIKNGNVIMPGKSLFRSILLLVQRPGQRPFPLVRPVR